MTNLWLAREYDVLTVRLKVKKLLLALLFAWPVNACTTFGLDGILAANYDWDVRVGRLMINKRSVAKSSFTTAPAHWTSRFASVTFNQYGRDFPTGGMNENGLAIALMALNDTQYPADQGRPAVGILEWIQYQLDLSADVDEVIRRSDDVRIVGVMGLHYLVSDRSGHVATIEFLDGALLAHTGTTLPVAVLANDTYDRSMSYLRTITGFGGRQPVPRGVGSLERFARAASMIQSHSADAFSILDSVHQPGYTRWSIVYNPQTLTVSFRTDTNPEVRSVSLRGFDLTCGTAVKIFDVNADASGDITSLFTDYTTALNLDLVNQAYDETPFLHDVSPEERESTARHPETSRCVVVMRRRAIS